MYGTSYRNANSEDVVLPPSLETSESKVELFINHIKQHRLIYAGLVIIGGIVVYKYLARK
jgi:hypothetical protein